MADTIKNTSEKIACLVSSEEWIAPMENNLRKYVDEGTVIVQTIDLDHVRSEYRRLCEEGYGAIIARGGTFDRLMEVADSISVLEVRVQTSDILTAILQCIDTENYNGKIYVVLYQKIAVSFEKNLPLFQVPIEVRRYRTPEELKKQIESIPEQQAMVVTSVLAPQVTSRKDLILKDIGTQAESAREAVERAVNHLRQSGMNVQHTNLMKSILSNIDEGILIFDQHHIICEVNHRAEQLLHMPVDELNGKDIREVIRDMPARRSREICEDNPVVFFSHVRNATLNVTIAPVQYYQEEKFIATIQDVIKIQEAERNIRRKLTQKGLVAKYYFEDILTKDAGMCRIIDHAKKIAGMDGSVLIYGENGTGKELFAQSIHNASRRRQGPFVAVNCAALTESLLESELFGYVGGSFTGAKKEGKAGLFELAHEGTIFLDEINSMPENLQAKILRVLEQREVMRVGSDYVIPLDLRVIAASNQPLPDMIRQDNFRRDLFFRLNTFEIRIPPVRERKKDILLLFRHYLAELNHQDPESIVLSADFTDLLLQHDWIGNVREIKSTVLRYFAFSGDNSAGDILKLSESKDVLVDENFKIDLRQLNQTVERMVIESLLDRQLTKTEIARALGISRQALYKKLK